MVQNSNVTIIYHSSLYAAMMRRGCVYIVKISSFITERGMPYGILSISTSDLMILMGVSVFTLGEIEIQAISASSANAVSGVVFYWI